MIDYKNELSLVLQKKISSESLGSANASPRLELFKAAEKNDVTTIKKIAESISTVDISLSSEVLSHPDTGATVLHHAILVSLNRE